MEYRKVVRVGLVVGIGVFGLAVAIRHDGGPLHGSALKGAHFQAGLPIWERFDYFAPAPTESFDGTIERVELVDASPGVRMVQAFVQQRNPNDMIWRSLPADVAYDYCCEPEPLFILRLGFDDPGAHSIGGITVDYRSGLFSYRTFFALSDWPARNPWAGPDS